LSAEKYRSFETLLIHPMGRKRVSQKASFCDSQVWPVPNLSQKPWRSAWVNAPPLIDLVAGGGHALVGAVGGRAGRGVAAVAAG
jgi:hypothetical protein